jgi:hypothetical protein
MVASDDESFNEFWRHYLRHHAQEGARLLHVLGTGLATLALLAAIVMVDPLIALRVPRSDICWPGPAIF